MEKETDILHLCAGFEYCINYSAAKTLTETSTFIVIQIRRPSSRFHGVINIASAVYDLSDLAILNKTHVVSFRDMIGKEKCESKPRRGKISRDGSKRNEQSSNGEFCEMSSLDLSDGTDSTSSSSSTASMMLKEWNCVTIAVMMVAGSDGGCWLGC
ncbi:uncharacterized protein Fot_08021 [Forsythia ovata]|uniref:Uncharacterized protein n=1 Tax=Forsythia ovata TaxID=205694 RepID=A0ABD1WXX5_9LAMI